MGVTLRTGVFGDYYGNDFNSSNALTMEQMKVNATYIYNFFTSKGFTVNSISAMLGNMQVESSLNPGRWQNNNVGVGPAYGLVQWDPFTKYTNWVEGDASTMDNNLSRIMYEYNNNIQYYPTDSYPETFKEFSKSTKSITYLTTAFLKNYERAGVEHLETRINNANNWYSFLTGLTPSDPVNPVYPLKKRKKGFNFILFNRKRRFKRV